MCFFFSGVFAWQQIAFFFPYCHWNISDNNTNINEPKFDWNSKYLGIFFAIVRSMLKCRHFDRVQKRWKLRKLDCDTKMLLQTSFYTQQTNKLSFFALDRHGCRKIALLFSHCSCYEMKKFCIRPEGRSNSKWFEFDTNGNGQKHWGKNRVHIF